MKIHPFKRFIAFTLCYLIAFIFIFVLQFKTESIISKNINGLNLTLAQTEKGEKETNLQNQFKIAYKGLILSSSELNPAYGIKDDGTKENLILESYSLPDEQSVLLKFRDLTSVLFYLSKKNEDTELFIVAKPSAQFTKINIPYALNKNMNQEFSSTSSSIISTKNSNFILKANNLSNSLISLTQAETTARFQSYDPGKKFTFENITNFAKLDEKEYSENLQLLRDELVSKVAKKLQTAEKENLSESEITCYVAEMIKLGKYNEALDLIPASFKNGNKRTYISSPYFNNLANMNKGLVMQTEKYASMVSNAIETKNLAIFTVDGIGDYILREKKTEKIRQLLLIPSKIENLEPNLLQAVGIISLYSKLFVSEKPLSAYLEAYLQKCITVIEDLCTFNNGELYLNLSEDADNFYTTILTGTSLVKLAKCVNQTEYNQGGLLLINTAIAKTDAEKRNSQLLSQVYPVLFDDNKFYPHTEILGYYGETCVWAWTCAENIDYTVTPDSIVNINIDFPLYLTHHVIFNGIPNFHAKIEIQKQIFRTDPRFETYNSSGYIYQTASQTFMLKSRHKSKVELIRLFCDPQKFTDVKGNTIITSAREE